MCAAGASARGSFATTTVEAKLIASRVVARRAADARIEISYRDDFGRNSTGCRDAVGASNRCRSVIARENAIAQFNREIPRFGHAAENASERPSWHLSFQSTSASRA